MPQNPYTKLGISEGNYDRITDLRNTDYLVIQGTEAAKLIPIMEALYHEQRLSGDDMRDMAKTINTVLDGRLTDDDMRPIEPLKLEPREDAAAFAFRTDPYAGAPFEKGDLVKHLRSGRLITVIRCARCGIKETGYAFLITYEGEDGEICGDAASEYEYAGTLDYTDGFKEPT